MWGSIFLEASVQQNFNFGFSTHKSDVLLHLSQWQYWWWFWFSLVWVAYFYIIVSSTTKRAITFNPVLNTSLRSHGKWGDFLVALIPLSWCGNILVNSNFILRVIEWQNESSLFTLRIQGKQWYWVYKYDGNAAVMIDAAPKNIGHDRWVVMTPTESYCADSYYQALNLAAQLEFQDVYNLEIHRASTTRLAMRSVALNAHTSSSPVMRVGGLDKAQKYAPLSQNSNFILTTPKINVVTNPTPGTTFKKLYAVNTFKNFKKIHTLKNTTANSFTPNLTTITSKQASTSSISLRRPRHSSAFIAAKLRATLYMRSPNKKSLLKLMTLRHQQKQHSTNYKPSKLNYSRLLNFFTTKTYKKQITSTTVSTTFLKLHQSHFPQTHTQRLERLERSAEFKNLIPTYKLVGKKVTNFKEALFNVKKQQVLKFVKNLTNPRLIAQLDKDFLSGLNLTKTRIMSGFRDKALEKVQSRNLITKSTINLRREMKYKSLTLFNQTNQSNNVLSYALQQVHSFRTINSEDPMYKVGPSSKLSLRRDRTATILNSISPSMSRVFSKFTGATTYEAILTNKKVSNLRATQITNCVSIKHLSRFFKNSVIDSLQDYQSNLNVNRYLKSRSYFSMNSSMQHAKHYDFLTLDDTQTTAGNTRILLNSKPLILHCGILNNHVLDVLKSNARIKTPLLFTISTYKGNDLEEKVMPTENLWGFRQKKYKRVKSFQFNDAMSYDPKTFEAVSREQITAATHRFIATNRLKAIPESDLTPTTTIGRLSYRATRDQSYTPIDIASLETQLKSAGNPYYFYTGMRLNKKRSDLLNVTLARRLLRTKRTLVLPAHVNITVITNSYDVVHSWFVPGLGLKLDCVPGRSTHHTFYVDNVGFYYGQCAEICGRYHHHMPIRLCAIPFEHFLVWWHTKGLPRSLRLTLSKKTTVNLDLQLARHKNSVKYKYNI